MLITSRAHLICGRSGGCRSRVDDSAAGVIIDTLRSNESAQLMVTIARQLEPRFRDRRRQRRGDCRICRQLDGLPLALEIAANWLDIYSPNEWPHSSDAGWACRPPRAGTPLTVIAVCRSCSTTPGLAKFNRANHTGARLTCFRAALAPRQLNNERLSRRSPHADEPCPVCRYAGSRYSGLHPSCANTPARSG